MPFIRDGHFDQYRMIETIKEALDPARMQPGKLTRRVANMEWAVEAMVIIRGILQANPFYVPSDEMLKELNERGRSEFPA